MANSWLINSEDTTVNGVDVASENARGALPPRNPRIAPQCDDFRGGRCPWNPRPPKALCATTLGEGVAAPQFFFLKTTKIQFLNMGVRHSDLGDAISP